MNEDQEKAYIALLNNENIFSHRQGWHWNIVYDQCHLRADFKVKKNIWVTASTAIAAQMYPKGSTVHSFAGLSYELESVAVILINMTDLVIERLKTVQMLIIDEIPMLPVHLLKKLNIILKNIKNSKGLFG